MVDAAGGIGIPVEVDLAHDDQIESLYDQMRKSHGRLDIHVNNAFRLKSTCLGGKFWEHPIQIWDDQVGIGLVRLCCERICDA